MFANSFLQSFLQSCGLANFLQGINRSIIWRLNHGVSKRLQLLEVGVQRSFVPREEFLGRPFDNYFWPYQSRIGWGVGYEETARWGLFGPKFDKEFKSKIISTKNRAKVFVFFSAS